MRMNVLPVALHKLVQRVVDELAEKAAARDVGVMNDVPDSLSAPADSGRLQQVLTNLIDNALKYGREHGQVIIEASAANDEVTVSVSDDGPGIPAEARERVFERFFRVDKARSREQGGTGLGLSIVKHIVQAHGGRVWVDRSAAGGAKFCLTLPLKRD
jgi:signal transduction histidine kinase